jgi:hypothetical protein
MSKFTNSLKIIATHIFRGKVSLPKQYLGRAIIIDDQEYSIFRCLRVDSQKAGNSAAVFRVKFEFRNLPVVMNKSLSMIPVPFLIGLSGFREKYWTISEDGYFQGIYQWKSEEAAKNYPESFIFKLMTKRAAPGTVNYEVIPDTELSDYIERYFKQ